MHESRLKNKQRIMDINPPKPSSSTKVNTIIFLVILFTYDHYRRWNLISISSIRKPALFAVNVALIHK